MQIGPNRGIWDGRGAMASGWESEGLGFELQQLQATFESNKNILSLKDPLKIPNFSIFSLWFKRNLFGLGQKVFGSNVGQLLLFTVGQRYARVGSGPISIIIVSPEGWVVFFNTVFILCKIKW